MVSAEFQLLKEMCAIKAPSGDESKMTQFILKYIKRNASSWKVKPVIYSGDDFQETVILVFGKPTTAIYAHLDNIGFTVRYGKQLVKIGGPQLIDGTRLVGADSKGKIDCELMVIDHESGRKSIEYLFKREIERGTCLSYKPKWRENRNFVQCCYMDNRLGVWNALQVAETLENGAIVFSTYEEHGGGSAQFAAKFLYEKYNLRQALISDITWITEGVKHGKGVVISMRDSGIPRRVYLNKIIALAKKSGIDFQLEVESSGGSDGQALQASPYPIDWVFIGAPEENVHTADEMVHKKDIRTMVELYKYLMKHL